MKYNMKKFIVIYSANESAMKELMKGTAEDRKNAMGQWMQWAKKCGSGLVDLGSPLGNGQKVTSSGGMPSPSWVVGYSILQAENMAEAIEMLKEHPHTTFAKGCEIQVYESMRM